MMPTKVRGSDVPDLKAEVIALLLRGWPATPPPGVPLGPHGFGGGLLDCYTPGGMAGLWRVHEAYLRDVAREWGWAPRHRLPDGTPAYYAERASLVGDDHGADEGDGA